MIVGTLMQEVVHPLFYHFIITYIEGKSKVAGSQDGGSNGDPRLLELGIFCDLGKLSGNLGKWNLGYDKRYLAWVSF